MTGLETQPGGAIEQLRLLFHVSHKAINALTLSRTIASGHGRYGKHKGQIGGCTLKHKHGNGGGGVRMRDAGKKWVHYQGDNVDKQ